MKMRGNKNKAPGTKKSPALQSRLQRGRFLYSLSISFLTYPNSETAANRDASREETRDTTVICVLIDGPAVSLKGSPTVSPVTAAL